MMAYRFKLFKSPQYFSLQRAWVSSTLDLDEAAFTGSEG